METSEVIKDIIQFRDDRNWQQFHNLNSLSRALSIEVAEVNKIFLWQADDSKLTDQDKHDLELELADVLTYAYYMCEKLDLDPNEIIEEKLKINQNRKWDFGKK